MPVERTVGTKLAFDGKLLKLEVCDVELEGGRRSVREIVRHRGATVILAELPDGRFVLVRQYRAAIGKELLEVVAGTLDPGETVEQCARRETREETGHQVRELTALGVIYPAPGYTDEQLHLFHASLEAGREALRTDEDEQIECVYADEHEIGRLIDTGQVLDAKTLAIWMLWQRKRER